ncbi:MAG: amino acid ABC transporter permease [Bacilli bacterium]|jgi:putative lysine transport system permease protein|nr:amino acid ABC transporter permease [Bacilli bacterium]
MNNIVYLLQNYYPLFIEGLYVTLLVAIIGTFGGIILGLGLYFLRALKVHFTDKSIKRLSKKFFSFLATAYIDIIRGTPMIVQGALFWYGFAAHLNMNILVAATIIIAFNTAAYIAEIIRSGVIALGIGQIEAGQSLGMSRFQIMLRIIFPQAIKNSLPSLLNELIVNIKDSSVLSIIGLTDLFYNARGAASESLLVNQAYVIVAVIYFIITFSLSKIISYVVEKKTNNKYDIKSTSV